MLRPPYYHRCLRNHAYIQFTTIIAVPETYQAASLPAQGATHNVTPRSLAPLEPNEVAIRVTATAINPVDWKIQDTGLFSPSWPAILGSDAAGEIAAVGADVAPGKFAVGDRVFFQGIIGTYESRTFQQYCKMPAELVAKTPSNVTDEQAAGISLAAMASLVALYDGTVRGSYQTI